MPEPLAKPNDLATLEIDASGGVRAPAPAKLELLFRGDEAVALNAAFSSVTKAEAEQYLRESAKELYDFSTISSATFSYDEAKREFRRVVTGDIKLNWRNGWYRVPHSGVGFDADFERPAGPNQEAPVAIAFPQYSSAKVTIKLPAGFGANQPGSPPVNETLAGYTYVRTVTKTGNRLILERSSKSVAAEVLYKDALAATPKLKALDDEDVNLRMPDSYKPTPKDLAALSSEVPSSAYEYVERGAMYLATNQYDAAIKDFTEANRLDPRNPWALANRAIANVGIANGIAAKKDADAALAIQDENWVAFQALGMIAEMDGKPEEAVKQFSKVQDKNPGDRFSLFHRASNALAAGQLDVAERDLKTLKAMPGMESALAPLEGQLFMAQGKSEQAVAAYTVMLGNGGRPAFTYMQRAAAFQALGKEDEALADTAAGLKIEPAFARLRLLRANILRSRGSKADALKEADLLLKYGPKDTFAHVMAGKIYGTLGDPAQAMETFAKALAIKEQGFIYMNRADIRPKDDKAGRAADVKAALRLDPGDNSTLSRAAEIFMRDGNYADALATLDKLSEPASDYKAQRATLLAKMGRTAEAQNLLAEAIAGAKMANEFNSLCWNEATAGVLLDQALASCKRAVELAPANAAYHDSLGMAFLRLGKFDDSVAAYDKAISRRPKQAESLMGRALALAGKGDLVRARADAKAARQQDPQIDETFAAYGLKFEDQNRLTSK
jgi:tetratricopeptide (TPR) repeat protein